MAASVVYRAAVTVVADFTETAQKRRHNCKHRHSGMGDGNKRPLQEISKWIELQEIGLAVEACKVKSFALFDFFTSMVRF